jgi:voltage-gated potassium channel
MEQPPRQHWLGARLEARARRSGMTPRNAAMIISVFWLIGVVIFGVVERLVDPNTFNNIWLGMWWAIQTVTTVGYGDVVPASTAGKAIASVLMLGGLSLFAVVTGAITSAFVTQAQRRLQARAGTEDPVIARLDAMGKQLDAMKAELDRLQGAGD